MRDTGSGRFGGLRRQAEARGRGPARLGHLAPAAVILLALAGCAQTVSPERFLYVYRRSAPPGRIEEGWFARYTGRDGGYHYLEVRHSTLDRGAGPLLLYGAFRDETLRCPVGDLPYDFPDTFRLLYTEAADRETDQQTYSYIRTYLAEYGLSPEGSSTAPHRHEED